MTGRYYVQWEVDIRYSLRVTNLGRPRGEHPQSQERRLHSSGKIKAPSNLAFINLEVVGLITITKT